MNISFYGSTIFSLEILKAIHQKHKEGKLDLKYIVSQPAKPFGRKRELKNNPVAEYAIANNLVLYTPEKLSEIFTKEVLNSKELNTDIAVVMAYGKIISQKVLNTAKYGFINFHPSLLPEYRGAGPFQMSILNQDRIGGVSLIKMDKEMDSGDLIKKVELEISENITAGELMPDLIRVSVSIIEDDFEYLFSPEKWRLEKQDHSKATYCYEKDLTKDNFEIRYEDGVKLAHGKIMSANPQPLAWINLESNEFKKDNIKNSAIRRINLVRSKFEQLDEAVTLKRFYSLSFHRDINTKKLYLELYDGFLEILELQPEGKNIMDAKGFANGYLK